MQQRNGRLGRVLIVCLSLAFISGALLGPRVSADDEISESEVAIGDGPIAEGNATSESQDSATAADSNEIEVPRVQEVAGITWHTDYAEAYRAAKREGRMLLINFVDTGANQASVEQTIANSEPLRRKISMMVPLRVSQDELIQVGGEPKQLLREAAFREMHNRAGIAIIDLKTKGEPYYGHVVSAYPFTSSKYYRWQPNYLHTIVDLPPGTITQRTMVWAVRIHPERPASVLGEAAEPLLDAAASHSFHQASMGVQGHHQWDSRFHQVRSAVGASDAVEVVAESWPNQNMIDSCIDCVDSWRQSSGHWGAVKRWHRLFGYDIKRGRNGIWYGTGIFAN